MAVTAEVAEVEVGECMAPVVEEVAAVVTTEEVVVMGVVGEEVIAGVVKVELVFHLFFNKY